MYTKQNVFTSSNNKSNAINQRLSLCSLGLENAQARRGAIAASDRAHKEDLSPANRADLHMENGDMDHKGI